MNVRFLEAEAALERVADHGFRAAWAELAGRDPKTTWFQEPWFVAPWYRTYRDSWTPLLALGESSGGELAGVMPLAVRDAGVAHAGDHQCQYHGWVADPEVEGEFPARVVRQVFRRRAPDRWLWKYLPPGTPVDWLHDLGDGPPAGIRHRTLSDPLLDVTDPEFLEERRASGSLRNTTNRLERRGMRYERIGDPDRAVDALRRLAPWCDLRQGATHGDLPFLQDPAKLPFHEALVRDPEHVWLSVLRLDDEIFAAHVAFFDGRELFSGVQGYDPAEGRCSPGIVLLLEMAEDLARCGARALDLTPGGDRWKERYASRHREIDQVELVRSRLTVLGDRAARTLESGARRAIRGMGVEPSRMREGVERVGTWLGSEEDGPGSGLYALPLPSPAGDARQIDRQQLIRLLLDHVGDSGSPDEELLGDTLRRFYDEWEPVAIVDSGRLRLLAWVPPAEVTVHLDGAGAPSLQREGAPEPQGCTPLAADQLLVDVVVEADAASADDVDRLLRAVAARRCEGRGRLLVRAGADAPRTTSRLARVSRPRAVG